MSAYEPDAIDRIIIDHHARQPISVLAMMAGRSVATIDGRIRRLKNEGLLGDERKGPIARKPVDLDSAVLERLALLEAQNMTLAGRLEKAEADTRAALDQAKHAIRKLDELMARIAEAAARGRAKPVYPPLDPLPEDASEDAIAGRRHVLDARRAYPEGSPLGDGKREAGGFNAASALQLGAVGAAALRHSPASCALAEPG